MNPQKCLLKNIVDFRLNVTDWNVYPISSWNAIKIKIKQKYINKEGIAHRVKDTSQKMKAHIVKKIFLKKEIQRKSENWFHRVENSETYMSIGEEATKS